MIARQRRIRLAAVVVVATALAAAGCGSSSKSSSPSSPAGASVEISNFKFAPASIVVKAGTRVSFTNHDTSPHTATARDMTFDAGTLKPGQSASVVLSKPGTYAYYCQFHAFMSATITVK